MSALYLLDPNASPAWRPFQDSRPVAELRAGAWLIRERWEAIASAETVSIFAPEHLHRFCEPGVPPVAPMAPVEGPALIGRSEFAPSGVAPVLDPGTPARLVHEGATVGWWVPAGTRWDAPTDDAEAVEIEGVHLRGAWDVITALEHLLVADCADFVQEGGDSLPEGITILGDPHDVILLGAVVEPGVVFDVRQGAVVLEQGAYVGAGSRLQGPCYVGPGTVVFGGPVSGSAFGPQCRVRGELSSVVFLGYANKSHDGFVGHTVVGRWANIGAGTVTSNLKNTYGDVRLDLGGTSAETGRQFLGSLIGDHAKIAIGTMLPTGTVVGVGANVFGSGHPPKYVAPFAWGVQGERMREDGFLAVAERVMPRRQIALDDGVRAMLTAIYRHSTG